MIFVHLIAIQNMNPLPLESSVSSRVCTRHSKLVSETPGKATSHHNIKNNKVKIDQKPAKNNRFIAMNRGRFL